MDFPLLSLPQDVRQWSEALPDVEVVLDGSKLEGGGGLIRDALTYSAILGKSVRIESIRANRPGGGGLLGEHTMAIETLASLCNAMVVGNFPTSHTLSFYPYRAGNNPVLLATPELDLELEGAASIFLIALLPYLLFSHLSPTHYFESYLPKGGIILTIKAGTLAVEAPSWYYIDQVLLPTLNVIGLKGHIELSREFEQGWHTQGTRSTGLLKVWVKPLEKPLLSFHLLKRGAIVKITATATVPSPSHQYEGGTFEQILRDQITQLIPKMGSWHLGLVVEVTVSASNNHSEHHLLISAHTQAPEAHLGYELVYPQPDFYPTRLSFPENEQRRCIFLIRACIKGLTEELESGSAVDRHMSDILTPYQVLADGQSVIALESEDGAKIENGKLLRSNIRWFEYGVKTASEHRLTSYWVARKMTEAMFEDHGWYLTCDGIRLGRGGSEYTGH